MAVALVVGLLAWPAGARAAAFTFTLAKAGRTSAGVFSRAGALLRTLWSGVELSGGAHVGRWDGTDDAGRRLPNGRYEVRVLTSRATYTWEGVVGNTSDATSGPTVFHFMSTISGMAVAGGMAYVAAGYNEGYTSQARFSTTDTGKKISILAKGAQFWKVATDGERVYWAGDDPNVGDHGFVVATRVGDDAEVAFDARLAPRFATRYGMAYVSAVDVVHARGARPSGLAVQRKRPYLFVAHAGMNRVDVLDRRTGRLVQTYACEAPGDLAVDANDDLWMVQGAGGARVARHMSVRDDGALVAGAALAGLERPLAIGASSIVVAVDGGTRQQLRAFDLTGKPMWTFGRAGGYAGDPVVTDDRFDFEPAFGLTGYPVPFVAFQPDGSFWVGDPGCERLQHYAADRTFLGRVAYVPLSYSAVADANDPSRVFADYLEFAVDYTLPLGPANGSWRLVRNWRPGVPARLDGQYVRMRELTTLGNGRTYASFGGKLLELPARGPLRDTGVAMPGQGRGSSLYADGSVRSVDERDGRELWLEQRLVDFDEAGNPRWSEATVVASAPLDDAAPHDIGNNAVLHAGPRTSSGVIVSFDFSVPQGASPIHGGWHLGGVKSGADRWLWRASPSTPRNYSGPWPDDGSFYLFPGNAGGAVLTEGRNIFYAYRGEGWKGHETNKWRHYLDDGLFVAEFGSDGSDKTEAPPEMAGNDFRASLVRLPDGRAFIYHNDESYHGGVHRWRLDHLDDVSEQVAPIVLASERPVRSRSDVDLLAGLRPDSAVVNGTAGWTFDPPADDEWTVLTNQKTWHRELPVDIDARFFKKTPGARASLVRALPSDAAPLARWRLDARIDYEDNYINHGSQGGQYLDVLDPGDKIIARFYPTLLVFPSARLYGNRAVIAEVPSYGTINDVTGTWQPLRITAEAGRVTFAYAGYAPVTAEPFDADADWRRPRRLRLSFFYAGAPYRRACQLDDLTFRGERR